MKASLKSIILLLASFTLNLATTSAIADNQTLTLSPILPNSQLPFRIVIEEAGFLLPTGFHSGVVGVYNGLWVFIAGRTNGLHGFGVDPFPPSAQNTVVYVVNPATGRVTSRDLTDPSSGLTRQQIDSLSVTSPQGYQDGNTLYMSGGYGVETNSGEFNTKPVLTAIYLPGIVKWVNEPNNKNNNVAKNIQQVWNPIFQIAGGEMFKLGKLTQLVFGQNFSGVYTPASNGDYSKQVRQFQITNPHNHLAVNIVNSRPNFQDPVFRRRDLNIVPAILTNNNRLSYGLVAYAGVFTDTTGVWTVPVTIHETGNPIMADPASPAAFKQAMNQYVCATATLYSKKFASNYNIFFGGMSYGFFSGGVFTTDSEIPFINQVTTVKMDKNGHFSQYIMDNEYPTIASTGSNPGNTLLFGSGAYFLPAQVLRYANGIISLDNIRKPTVIGYIVGGIMSTLPNTNVDSDSTASPYVFKVTLVPTG